jgi:hypothetical protein
MEPVGFGAVACRRPCLAAAFEGPVEGSRKVGDDSGNKFFSTFRFFAFDVSVGAGMIKFLIHSKTNCHRFNSRGDVAARLRFSCRLSTDSLSLVSAKVECPIWRMV